MAQVYKMMLGTSGRQWEQLTVSEDGTMMLYFHGTDRSVTTQVTLIEDGAWKGWLKSEGGSLYPGIESGRWQAVDCPAESAEIAESAADAVVAEYTGLQRHTLPCQRTVPAVSSDDEVARITEGLSPACSIAHESETTINPAPVVTQEPPVVVRASRPRRQRKARKPAVATASRRNEGTAGIVAENAHGLHGDYDAAASGVGAEQKDDHAWLRSVGYLAAASVALLVIWQTGLIIPLGLLGLATSGFLK